MLEGVALEVPRYFHQNAFAPTKAYWHLDVPAGVSLGMNADRAHRGGVTGRGIKVVMCDTGWFAHPYFSQRGYRSSPVVLGPASANAAADEVGQLAEVVHRVTKCLKFRSGALSRVFALHN